MVGNAPEIRLGAFTGLGGVTEIKRYPHRHEDQIGSLSCRFLFASISHIIEIFMLPSPLGQFGIHIPLSPQFLLFVMSLLLVAWGVFTLVIRYHWAHYSARKTEIST
mgnify:FL=1